jgi:electron transfer flavoprotein beta subunit
VRVAVLVKQVPATENVKIDESTGTMIREGVEAELNPLDLHAVEEAVRLKERFEGTEITVISMGPPQAKKAVKAAIAMGCDRGTLLSDGKFAGSDTLATARTLAAGIVREGAFQIVLSGERATDGETGQVGPAVGHILGMSVLTFVSGVESVGEDRIVVRRAVEGGHERVEAPLPAMLSVVKEINVPRLCTLGGKIRAKRTEIPLVGAKELGLPEEHLGLAGSPTKVVRVSYPQITRNGKKVPASDDLNAALDAIRELLADRRIV